MVSLFFSRRLYQLTWPLPPSPLTVTCFGSEVITGQVRTWMTIHWTPRTLLIPLLPAHWEPRRKRNGGRSIKATHGERSWPHLPSSALLPLQQKTYLRWNWVLMRMLLPTPGNQITDAPDLLMLWTSVIKGNLSFRSSSINTVREVEPRIPTVRHSLDNYPYSDGDWSPSNRFVILPHLKICCSL